MTLHVKIAVVYFVSIFTVNASDVFSKLEALSQFQRPYKPIVIEYNPFVKEGVSHFSSNASHGYSLAKNELQLLSIINNKAFISGQWYRVGDTVDGGKIIRIDKQKVDIQKEARIQTLSFEQPKSVLHVKDSRK